MAKVVTDDSHYKAIADAIRENMANAGMNEAMRPSEMAEWVNTACDIARAEGETEGVAEGVRTEYDRFWDRYQQNGNRTDYLCGFAGDGWNVNTFKPKYNIVPTTAYMLFRGFGAGREIIDLVTDLAELGVQLDFSKCTNFQYAFMGAYIHHIGVIDTRAASAVHTPFGSGAIVTIDKLILRDDGSQTFATPFSGASALTNLTVEGVIGQNGFSLQGISRLSKASITSVVNALSGTTNGLSVTFSKAAVNNAFTTAEWSALAGTKPNWTINLV